MNQVSGFVYSLPEDAPKTARGRQTWQRLLEAAEKEFGERGFHEAAINRITEGAGVAMGTFYVHFESKEAIFRALVFHMGHLTRRWIAGRVSGASDRLDAERKGLEAFIEFARENRDLYRIVNEAQFVAPDAYRQYYSDFAEAYAARLGDASSKGEIRPGEDEQRAWALIGASVFLGMKFGVWDDHGAAPAEVAENVGDLFAFGLSPKDAAEPRKKNK
ncbi:MAG: TetR/AcrR family transcriptional regulator [Pseudomonadota bacterium]